MPESQASALIATLPFAVLLIGRDERIVAANPAAETLLGAGIAGRTFVTVIRQPVICEALENVLASGREDRVRLRLTTPARELSVVATIAPLDRNVLEVLPAGGVSMTFEDVTPLEEAEAMRRDFVANVSHELRTPLTALMGFIETLRGAARDDPAARDRFLAIMEREALRMNRLVGDLLSLSRVESEERRRPTSEVDMSAVLKGAIQTLQPTANAQAVRILRSGEEGRIPVQGDPDQLTQVFSNLIENAIKYGGSGGEIRVHLDRIGHEPVLRGPALRVDVIDQGEGIDEIHLPRLTERFYRVDTHRSREKGGTGLGLAIVKHIVARHRGRLKIESRKGEGSRFSVLLPLG